MFGIAYALVSILQWVVFLAILAILAGIAMVVARMFGIGKRGRRITGLVVTGVAFLFLNVQLDQYVSGKYLAYLCETEAGTFIERTVDNVEGFYIMRLRDPRDLIDRMAAGDVPEEPYGHTNWEAQDPGTLFVNPPWSNYRFVEMPLLTGPTDPIFAPGYLRLSEYRMEGSEAWFVERFGYQQSKRAMRSEAVTALRSKYGYTWSEASTRTQAYFHIHRGEWSVVDLSTGRVLARHIAFIRTRGGGTCPRSKSDTMVYDFVSSVLLPMPVQHPE